MTTPNHVIHIDFETCSPVDLKLTGAYPYAKDARTMVTVVGYAIDDADPQAWLPWRDPEIPPDLLTRLKDPDTRLIAWNAAFDRVIYSETLTRMCPHLPAVPVARWMCAMVQAKAAGYPGSLKNCGKALRADEAKMDVGKDMHEMFRPRGVDKTTGAVTYWHETDPVKLQKLIDYCIQDVAAARWMGENMPEVTRRVEMLWWLDQEISDRGIYVDMAAVRTLMGLTLEAVKLLNQELHELTNGKVEKITQTGRLIVWVRENYLQSIQSLDQQSIERLLRRDDLPDHVRRVLEIRLAGAKTSTAKLEKFLGAVWQDDRVRGTLQFFGAFTGRYAGRGIQPQNFPRGAKGVEIGEILDLAHDGELTLAQIKQLSGDELTELDAVSTCLRGCIRAAPGKVLAVADFNAIEARAMAWVAGQMDVLDVFHRGEDLYVYTAEQVGLTAQDRQFGKTLALACQYGSGPKRVSEAASAYGIDISEQDMQPFVRRWRDVNSDIYQFWYGLDRAFRDAIAESSKHVTADIGTERVTGTVGPRNIKIGWVQIARHRCVFIDLPSGRRLYYAGARVHDPDNDNWTSEIIYLQASPMGWFEKSIWGGTFANHVVQGMCADLMLEAMYRVGRDHGIDGHAIAPILTVHDELVCEVPEELAQPAYERLVYLMTVAPKWGPDLPLRAEGYTAVRYRK